MVWVPGESFDLGLYEEIHDMVEASGYTILDHFLFRGTPTFYVELPDDSKKAFLVLMKRLRRYNFYPMLRKRGERYELRILREAPTSGKRSSRLLLFGLFAATIATIFIAGYLMCVDLINRHGFPIDPVYGGITYTLAMMAVLVTHEMGHLVASYIHSVKATPPFFIPGPPPFGTFGAIIRQKSPAPNKDALFDIGLSGPLFGFVASVIATLIGIQNSIIKPVISPSQLRGVTRAPFIYSIITNLVMRPPPGLVLIIPHPVAFAGWIGMIITMLNLIPAGMLDGGHIARCFMGPKQQLVISLIAAAAIALQGYYLMALLALLMALTHKHPGPLDDVSRLSLWRKISAVIPIAIFVLCLPL